MNGSVTGFRLGRQTDVLIAKETTKEKRRDAARSPELRALQDRPPVQVEHLGPLVVAGHEGEGGEPQGGADVGPDVGAQQLLTLPPKEDTELGRTRT